MFGFQKHRCTKGCWPIKLAMAYKIIGYSIEYLSVTSNIG